MNHKVLLILFSLFTAGIMLLAACGDKNDNSKTGESISDETTVIIETTAQGGTVEQDSEGNIITKDDSGNIVSVEDKDGNQVDVVKYLTTHRWVETNNSSDNSSSGGSSSSASGNQSVDSSQNSPGNSSGNENKPENGNPTDSVDNRVEESIPFVVATIPDVDDMELLPDF